MPAIDELGLKRAVGEILHRHPAVGLAVGVVRDGRLESFHGHGLADIGSKTPITEETVFRIASITKTFTAIAVMQLWEQGLVELDAPANEYLRAFRLIPAKTDHRPATVRHLLTHTAGIPEVAHPSDALKPEFGEAVEVGKPLPSLTEYYGEGLRLVAEPGTRFRYGNHSFATLGQIVEDVSGVTLARYFREHIFEPLGMDDSDLERTARVVSHLATGYTIGRHGAKPVTARESVTAAAASIYSTPADMARYVAALLGGGSNEHGSVLKPETLATMFEPQYQPDPRIPGLGLAFFRADLGGRLAVEHQGIMPGFNSEIFLAPGDGVGVLAFTNGARRAITWLPAETGRLLGDLIGVAEAAVRTDVPNHPEIWGDLCGWYWLPGPLSDVRLRGMMGAGAEVFVRGGRLMFRFLSPVPVLAMGLPLLPDDAEDPYVFRMDLGEFGTRVVFDREASEATTRLHLDLMPLTLSKRSGVSNPRRWLVGALGAVAVATTARGLRRPNIIRI